MADKKIIKVGSDFSGVGAFDYALKRVAVVKNFEIENIFACDMDKYARQSYLANHKPPNDYPENVYDREIPKESLDLYMTSPPCQSFSLAGHRKGKDDERGILFFNSHEFIEKNKPRFFIFENVKGLLSDNGGKTFGEWIRMLGGKSVNGLPILFPDEDSVPYHIFYRVLNSKKYGVPQSRERIFIIGIRDAEDCHFRFPKEIPLELKLKDILEKEIKDKFYLSERAVAKCLKSNINKNMLDKEIPETSRTLVAGYHKIPFDGQYLKVERTPNQSETDLILAGKLSGGKWDNMHESSCRVYDEDGIAPTIPTCSGGGIHPKVITDKATPKDLEKYYLSPTFEKYLREHREKNKLAGNGFGFVNGLGLDAAMTLQTKCGSRGTDMFLDYAPGRIRRLTPRECFRLMDFPEDFKFVVSDTQLYRQAGNSIVVAVLEALLKKMNL